MSTGQRSESVTASPSYDERLSIPWTWWPALLLILAIGVLEVASGFTYVVIVPVSIFLFGFLVVPPVMSARTRVHIRDGVLRAGGDELPVTGITSVQPLDREQTRLRLGPQADPSAHLVVRGWIGPSVMLRLSNPKPVPYWVVSTRRPQELADAIKSARAHIRATRA